MPFPLHFHVHETLPAVHRAARADRDPDTGPIRAADLGSMEWGALAAAGIVNGCGPTTLPDFIPDLSPAIRAAGFLHDLAYLAGGCEEDRQFADTKFGRTAPEAYTLAVRTAGHAFFRYRDKPLTHGELCLIIEAAFLTHGFANCQAKSPSVRVQAEIDRLARA
jgi:hypothetical protein